MIDIKRLLSIAALAFGLAAPSAAQPLCFDYADGNPVRGWTYLHDPSVSALVIDDVAYLAGQGPFMISVVDVSQPPAMPRIDLIRTEDRVFELVRDGERVYARTGGGVVVLDVSDPRAPSQLAWIELFEVKAIRPDGDVLHVALGQEGYAALDVSDPTAPELLAELGLLGNVQHLGLDRERDIAVLGLVGAGMRLVDVSDPRSPLEVGRLTDSLSFPLIEFVGTDLIVGGFYGVRIYDLGSVLDPRPIAELDEVRECVSFAVQDGRLLVCDARAGVHVYDIAHLPRVVRTAHHPQLQRTLHAAPADGEFLVNLFSQGYAFLDPTVDWREPATLAALATPGEVTDLAARDGLLVGLRSIGPAGGELFTARLSPTVAGDPRLASLTLAQAAEGLALGRDHAFVAARQHGLDVVDLADPRAPRLAASLGLGQRARDVALDGPWAHVALRGATDEEGGVTVVDAADPAAPQVLDHVPLFQRMETVAVVGHTVVAAGPQGRLFTIGGLEPGEPPAPAALAALELGFGEIRDLAVVDELVIVGGRQYLAVADVADPISPELLWSQPLLVQQDQVESLTVIGRRLYVATERAGVAIYDLADPAAPVFVGHATASGPDRAVAGDERILAVGGDLTTRYLPLHCDPLAAPGEAAAPAGGLSPGPSLSAYPIPANPRVTLSFALSRPGPAIVAVFDLRGRLVAELARGHLPAGEHRLTWDGRDRSGRAAATGTYLVRLVGPDGAAARKLSLIR